LVAKSAWLWLSFDEITEDEAIPFDDFPPDHIDSPGEHRTAYHARVELAAFAARVDVWREFHEQLVIVGPACK
jgi:hypothetical protein